MHHSHIFEEKLCFDKNEFLKENFSVDEFLHKNRNISLELLRDNMGLYLKKLRSSMIDLINEDYADFVNLSANLVGLDRVIDTIQMPLNQFRKDIETIQETIDTTISEIQMKLENKKQMRLVKRNLQCLKKVYETSQKLENLLANQSANDSAINIIDLERAALELLQLKFNEKFSCQYLDKEFTERINTLEKSILQKLRYMFGETVRSKNSSCSETLERCLRIYIMLDACSLAEQAFKEDFVAGFMEDIITEDNLQKTSQGLAGIYSKILNFISLHMTDLLRLTQYTDKIRGFNFLLESFWSDVEWRLETQMSSIFAPGNSEVFYIKYKCTKDFLQKIEELLSDPIAINTFRQHKQTKNFQSRWNLPVYFQICFQEIAGDFEAILEPILSKDTLNVNANTTANSDCTLNYQLKTFVKADQAIKRCWVEGVYLPEVFPKFFKLHIQILLRLSRWIEDVISHLKTAKSLTETQYTKITLLVAVHNDLQCLLTNIPNQEESMIVTNLPILSTNHQQLQQQQQQQPDNSLQSYNQLDTLKMTIRNMLKDVSDNLASHLHSIQKILESELITECVSDNIKQVNDLPRLYRKTNRDVPSRSSSYIEQMYKPLKLFKENYLKQLNDDIIHIILKPVLCAITKDYYDVVNDVLTSVQKTEESLRRLRNLKGGGTGSAPTSAGINSNNLVVSDDDKIRLQLRVDVSAWTTKLADLGFASTDIEKLADLNNLVENHIKVK